MSWFTTQIAIIVFCALLSFFASAWSNSVSRLSMVRAMRLEKEYPKKGRLLITIAENPRPYVAGTLLTLLIARITAVVLFTAILVSREVPAAELIAIVVLTFFLFQIAELAPRTWVLERADQVLLLGARPVYFLGKAMAPVSMFLIEVSRLFMLILPGRGVPRGPLTSEDEIKSILETAEAEEVIETEEREMIHSIFEFGDTVVREVMVPRPDMICVEADTKAEDILDIMLRKGVSRVPVIRESIDNIIGIVYLKDIVRRLHNGTRRTKRASEIARDPVFMPESKKVGELLTEMRQTKNHMVIVVDEYGGVSGLATLEDLLEEIVGEISDEYDREEPHIEPIDEQSFRVDARLAIGELSELLDEELPSEEWDSVGGLVAGLLGRVATEGDQVNINGVRFEVERVKGRRIAKVIVHHIANRGS